MKGGKERGAASERGRRGGDRVGWVSKMNAEDRVGRTQIAQKQTQNNTKVHYTATDVRHQTMSPPWPIKVFTYYTTRPLS